MSEIVRVLALETATPFLSVGLLVLEGALEVVAREHSERVERSHAEDALERIQEVFSLAGLEPRAEVIAIGTGPGSYTGVRIAASLALGLARAWNAALVGVPTLEAIAAAHEGTTAVSWDARKGKVYSAVYTVFEGSIMAAPVGIEKRTLEEFEPLVPDGALWSRDESPSGLALARLGLERFRRGQGREIELSYL